MRRIRLVALGVVLTAVGALAGCMAASAAAAGRHTDPTPSGSGPSVTLQWSNIQGPPGYGPAIPADSYRIVGGDFAPGIYRAQVASGSTCVYSVMVNDNGTVRPRLTDSASGGPVQVVLNSSDYGFQSRGCGPWHTV